MYYESLYTQLKTETVFISNYFDKTHNWTISVMVTVFPRSFIMYKITLSDVELSSWYKYNVILSAIRVDIMSGPLKEKQQPFKSEYNHLPKKDTTLW